MGYILRSKLEIKRFDFLRVDIETVLQLEMITETVFHKQEPIIVDSSPVSCSEITFPIGGRKVTVFLEGGDDIGTTHQDFLGVGMDQNSDAGEWLAHGSKFKVLGGVEGNHRAGFCHSISFIDAYSKDFREPEQGFRVGSGASHGDGPEVSSKHMLSHKLASP
jgi:hypothetical protein